jgi:hypothetical protein
MKRGIPDTFGSNDKFVHFVLKRDEKKIIGVRDKVVGRR